MAAVPRRTVLTLLAGTAAAIALAGCSRRVAGAGDSARPSPTSEDLSGTTTAAPEASTPAVAPVPEGVFTVLVIGSDTRNESSFKGLSDTIVVAQLNPAHNHVNLVSIARDSYVNGAKINASYSRGGPDRLRQVVSELLGELPIDATLETTFERFSTGMDLLGGVTVDNVHASDSFGSTFAAGPIHISGDVALNYVRERKGLPLGDFDRTERHRATLTGILDRLHVLDRQDAAGLVALVPRLYDKVRATDFPLDRALALLPSLTNLSATTVTSLMVPVSSFATRGGASVVLLDTARTAELGAALRTADLSGYVARYGTITTAID